jgi:predicted amidohydrolase YtcJ
MVQRKAWCRVSKTFYLLMSGDVMKPPFNPLQMFRNKKTGLLLATGLIAASTLQLAGCADSDSADLLLTNGRVYTFTWDDPAPDGTPAPNAPFRDGQWTPDAEAVAVKNGRIVFVGGNEEAQSYRGYATRVIDVNGGTILPGLVDSHTHIATLGANLARVDLTQVHTEQEAVELVVKRATNTPKGEWIVGWGWDEGLWAGNYPDMRLLSQRVPDHPAIMRSLHGFAVWGNKLAFDRAGITSSAEAPTGGKIEKDANSNPSGILLNRATGLLTGAIPAPTAEQIKARVLAGLNEMAKSGYVAVHEAGVDRNLMQALQSLNSEGRLPLRVYVMLSARDEDLLREWQERGPDQANESMLITRSVKAYYDGALGSKGARLLADYSDTPGHRGVSGEGYGFNQEIVADMIGSGFQVGIHAIGDAGNRETLDFFAEVFESHPQSKTRRHRIEHAQVIHPDDFQRFKELEIIASMQPPHAVEDKAWAEDRLGPERVRGAYAWRTLRQIGVPIIFNSDLAGSDHDIFYGLHAAITRRDKELEPAEGWYPEEALTAEEAVRGYAVWPAYSAFWGEETGTLAPGKWADITVLDIDPLDVGSREPEKLFKGSSLITIAAGKIVYEKAASDRNPMTSKNGN